MIAGKAMFTVVSSEISRPAAPATTTAACHAGASGRSTFARSTTATQSDRRRADDEEDGAGYAEIACSAV